MRNESTTKNQEIKIHPDPVLAAEKISTSFLERFLAKVTKTETCWNWDGAVNGSGGNRILRGRRRGGTIEARRASWILFNGEIPTGCGIISNCPSGNETCVHPNHLKAGTTGRPKKEQALAGAHIALTDAQATRFDALCAQAGTTHEEILDRITSKHTTPKWMLKLGYTSTFADRFWRKVKKTDSCWLWIGAIDRCGYGMIGIGSDAARVVSSHRSSWMLHNGPIPEGQDVLHDCPNGDCPGCVNPAHLWLGTARENAVDATQKQQAKAGIHWNSTISADQVAAVRLLRAKGLTVDEISERLGISRYIAAGIVAEVRHTSD